MDKTANGEGEEKVGRGLESPRTALLKGDFWEENGAELEN